MSNEFTLPQQSQPYLSLYSDGDVSGQIAKKTGLRLEVFADIGFYGFGDGLPDKDWVETQRQILQPHQQRHLDEIESQREGVERNTSIKKDLQKTFCVSLASLLNDPDPNSKVNLSANYGYMPAPEDGYFGIYRTLSDGQTKLFSSIRLHDQTDRAGVEQNMAMIEKILPALLTYLAGTEKTLEAQRPLPQNGKTPSPEPPV